MNSLSSIDIIVILVYLVGIVLYGISKSKRSSSEDYFLGGRTMTWPIVGIALFSANISSSTLVGLASDAFQTNVSVYNYEWYAVVVLIFFAIFFLPFYLRSGVYTMPEFLERRYDRKSRYYFSFITIVGNVLVDTAAALYVGSIVLKLLFPEVSSTVIIISLAIAAAAYTIPGGLNSVIQTEVIQAILLLIGSIFITYFAFDALGGGWDTMMTRLDEMLAAGQVNFGDKAAQGHYVPESAEAVFSLVRPVNDEFMPWWGLLTGVPLLGFYFWANNQFMVQRVLGAKNLNHGRWGALFAGFLKLPVIFVMVVPGVLAILLFNDLDISTLNYPLADGTMCSNLKDCPNLTYPVLLFQLLPTGFLGLVVAGLLAAMMSSVSATFNSASTLITMDFIQLLRPQMTSKQLVRAGQIATLVLVVLSSAWVPFIERVSDSLWSYLQLVIAFTSPPIVSAFVLGLFWKRANAHGAFASLMVGAALAIFMILSLSFDLVPYLNDFHFLAKANLLFVVSVSVHVLVSLSTPAPASDKVDQYTYKKEMIAQDTEEFRGLPWYQHFRILSLILLVITAIIVGYFW
ncbi:MAG: sodium:solute symporter [Flavobacteriaceae bacterium]|jgi:solute:Na+ symporter, SSS family|nr:sodium:solute symporter [Flavobacteriaceae bacterium]MDP4675243.1 sodium:solute symporter [Flavobacteriaceae bacterium]MDP4754807.1 sodium:solute symporter [Flavobacteriaceae bacterium]MDP4794939.1 sodium:solute symporter [Flavobacteriaceae bacterium]MDP4884840.1 sodium:solute symporter [Flavobacteriaceae bacterium]